MVSLIAQIVVSVMRECNTKLLWLRCTYQLYMIPYYPQLQVVEAEMHIQPHVTSMQLWKKKRSVPPQPSVADRVGESMFTRLQLALCRLVLYTAIWIMKSIFFWNMKVKSLTDPLCHTHVDVLTTIIYLFHFNTFMHVWCLILQLITKYIALMEIMWWVMLCNWKNG